METERPDKRVVWGSLAVFIGFFLLWNLLFSAPLSFVRAPERTLEIGRGASLDTIAAQLKKEQFIKYEFVFRLITRLRGDQRNLVAGDYAFEHATDVFALTSRLAHGQFDMLPVRVTIPEGLNKFEIAELLAKRIAHFDTEQFTDNAPEGYLFPDTYFFPRTASPDTVIGIMTENFDTKMEKISAQLSESKRKLSDVVAMASIVELEARKTDTRKIVAGVLWKRFDSSMPLQVDVSFKYINGKTTDELTDADLALDSPYNSYRYKGLPPTPIANPGLDAILATLQPTKTPYYFFLSDRSGVMHYAKTFEDHKKNKELYL